MVLVISATGSIDMTRLIEGVNVGCNGLGITSTNLFLKISLLCEILGDIVEEQISLDIVNTMI